MTDQDVVLRKLTSLREQVARLRRRRGIDRSTFLADVDRQDALGMSLLVAVQDAIDIALHIAADEGWGIPASYAEGFELLAGRGVVDRDLARELASLAALRNRIAHGYASVDMERVWNEVPEGLSALERYSSAVARLLGRAGEPG